LANSKEDAYLDIAENMFVFQSLNREEIARRLKLSDKTVRIWAKRYGWEEKKAALLQAKSNTHLELYDLVRTLTQGLKADVDGQKEISWQRISALNGLVQTVGQLKKYEDVVTVEKEKEAAAGKSESNKGQALADLRQTVHEVLGL
jgi:uncharacterized protein YjcR